MNALEPGELRLMRARAWIFGALALIASLIAEFINARIGPVPSGIIGGLVAVLLIYPVFIAPDRVYRSWGWMIDGEELHIHRGVWTKVETIVPFVRVQHLDVMQTAPERAFGVTSLVLHTAGTLHFRVVLPGLSRETAEAIRDEIRAVIIRDADDN